MQGEQRLNSNWFGVAGSLSEGGVGTGGHVVANLCDERLAGEGRCGLSATGAFVSRSGRMQGSSTSTGNSDEALPLAWRTGGVLSRTEGLTMGTDYRVCRP